MEVYIKNDNAIKKEDPIMITDPTKRRMVKVIARTPLTGLPYQLVGPATIDMDVNEIRSCICQKATVDLILSNKKLIRLDFTNYRRDFEAELQRDISIARREMIKKQQEQKIIRDKLANTLKDNTEDDNISNDTNDNADND